MKISRNPSAYERATSLVVLSLVGLIAAAFAVRSRIPSTTRSARCPAGPLVAMAVIMLADMMLRILSAMV
ncbi:MAG: hypothetical protein ACREJC_09385, partial [Tepidisphaeraceae bacterium]